MLDWPRLREQLATGELPSEEQALALADFDDTPALVALASVLRDRGHRNVVTYSRKDFIPLTHLCRDVCHYCTFAQTPKKIEQPYMPVEQVLELCREGAAQGCQEALFTLGEKPEARYSTARKALAQMGFDSTLDYVRHVAQRVLEETGLLPHINAGCMTAREIAGLRQVSASMGIMLESASPRLCEKGMPHYGSPDKDPARRIETMELAGEAAVPFTSGILIGIGETRRERIESLLALRRVHLQYGHLQEVIVQNFRAKPGTLMATAPEPDLEDLLWTIAVARLVAHYVRSMIVDSEPVCICDYPRTDSDERAMREFLCGIPLSINDGPIVRFAVSERHAPPPVRFRGHALRTVDPVETARVCQWALEKASTAPYRYLHSPLQVEQRVDVIPEEQHHHTYRYALVPQGERALVVVWSRMMYLVIWRHNERTGVVYVVKQMGFEVEEVVLDVYCGTHLHVKDALYSDVPHLQQLHRRTLDQRLQTAEQAIESYPAEMQRMFAIIPYGASMEALRALHRDTNDERAFMGLLRVPATLPYRTGDNWNAYVMC